MKSGTLHLNLNGKKLHGDWTLVRLKNTGDKKQPWLIIKSGSDHKVLGRKAEDQSALSKRSMAAISKAGDAEWKSGKRVSTQAVSFADELRKLHRSKAAFVEPMKAKLVNKLPTGSDWLFEIKFDGVRAIAIKDGRNIELVSRTRHSLSKSFPEIAASLRELPCKSVVLDGEIVALDDKGRSSFQLLQPFIHGDQPNGSRPPIVMYIFDILNLEGKATAAMPLDERKSLIEKLLRDRPDGIRVSSAFNEKPERLLKQIEKLGLEGLIAKRRDSRYEPGRRSGSWVKMKIVAEQEFVIGGYTEPQGSRELFGSLLVGYQQNDNLIYASKVGTGFDSNTLRSLFDQFKKLRAKNCPFTNLPSKQSDLHGLSASEMKRCTWLKPKMVCQIRFSQWTKDNHLRQPVFLGLRNDKPPKMVLRETPGVLQAKS
jgi:bifunctional non-homologous end joining protein LigD